eukprot:gnl/Chilomastix_cuspidata/1457.p1 GENE.gnl/Chilomastix_cuspidata/1457~~gnl/Chilomastix_cuspidata/1457.p1  ORF type:complete len:721 (-),score=167.76 gnl/Chilomastix_cuspidata/1457:5-1936(-)
MLAATFNPQLITLVGSTIARDAKRKNRRVLLAPGMNIIRTPRCGRAFEYFSEDPHLSAEIASAYVAGVQKEGVAACPKHFVCNTQERFRAHCDAIVSERALMEVYLPPFLRALSGPARAWTAMTAYNKLNGIPCDASPYLRRAIDGAGFDGVLMSDWFSTWFSGDYTHVWDVLDLECPKRRRLRGHTLRRDGSAEQLNKKCVRFLRLHQRVSASNNDNAQEAVDGSDQAAALRLAFDAAVEGTVLLQNLHDTLPFRPAEGSCVRVCGGALSESDSGLLRSGSSGVRARFTVTPLEGIYSACTRNGVPLVTMRTRAACAAKKGDLVVLVTGTRCSTNEREGKDRAAITLPPKEWNEVLAVSRAVGVGVKPPEERARLVLVLLAGAPVTLPRVDVVDAILLVFFPGMEGGNALGAILFGAVSPSGKLPVTTFKRAEDCPAHAHEPHTYPGVFGAPVAQGEPPTSSQVKKFLKLPVQKRQRGLDARIIFAEGVLVGHRYVDYHGLDVQFPFGFGLTYTRFALTHFAFCPEKTALRVNATPAPSGPVELSVDVENVGPRDGKEVVQVYLSKVSPGPELFPPKLISFSKIDLSKGEKARVPLTVDLEVLRIWDESTHAWACMEGEYRLAAGTSSRDLVTSLSIFVDAE